MQTDKQEDQYPPSLGKEVEDERLDMNASLIVSGPVWQGKREGKDSRVKRTTVAYFVCV